MNGHITDTGIIHTLGSLHQGDEYQFEEYSRGRQCVANSITAIAYAQMTDIASWDSHDLDFILKEGDCLYRHIRPQQFFDQIVSNGLLELDDIPLECDIFERHFKIIHQGNLYCDINKQAIDGLLQQISGDNNKSHAILVMGDQHGAYASSLINYGKIYFYLMDIVTHVLQECLVLMGNLYYSAFIILQHVQIIYFKVPIFVMLFRYHSGK